MEDKFRIDYQIQSDIKEALEIAKWYCKENRRDRTYISS